MTITLVFEKNVIFLRRKLAEIAENYEHNIDPRRFTKNSFSFSLIEMRFLVPEESYNS
jgi:hypothetical protein